MNYQDINPNLPAWAARKAWNTLPPNTVCTADMEDMRQEAHLTIWQAAPRARGEGYLYCAGMNAALLWWRYNVAGVKTYHDGKTGGFATNPSLDNTMEDDNDFHEFIAVESYEEAEEPTPLLVPEREKKIRSWLRAYGPWTKERCIRRAVNILALLIKGYNVRDIAQELRMSIYTVYAYRRSLRAVLQQVYVALSA